MNVLAFVGAHALGRNLQRGASGNIDGLVEDLRALSRGLGTTVARAIMSGNFDLAVPVTGGAWHGVVARREDDPALWIRTFI
jgi:hypothetical protein